MDDGLTLGFKVGREGGPSLGFNDGPLLGVKLGRDDVSLLGCNVGCDDGSMDTLSLRIIVGCNDGNELGKGINVGCDELQLISHFQTPTNPLLVLVSESA